MVDYFLKKILNWAVKAGASDVHVGSGEQPALRIDGELLRIEEECPVQRAAVEDAMNWILDISGSKPFECGGERDLAFALPWEDGSVRRFRASLYYEKNSPAFSIRIVPPHIKTFDELHLPTCVKRAAAMRSGLFLITGYAGAGKSATLAAIVQYINTSRAAHIITVEDPIEYIYESKRSLVRQREVGRDTEGFYAALRSALRQDPDVIMIGELRDAETASAAITAAETGHLVLSTLHARGAAQSVDRLIDMFEPGRQAQIRTQIAASLAGVLSQQLVPLAGRAGRAVATEYMSVNAAVRSCIRDGKSAYIKNIIQTGADDGMHSMEQDLAKLYFRGLIADDVARTRAFDAESLERYLTAR